MSDVTVVASVLALVLVVPASAILRAVDPGRADVLVTLEV